MYYIRDMDTLAKRLTWAREQRGLTQEGLAKLSGVSQGTIGNLESGIRQTARKIVDIAAAVGVDPVWLANGGSEPGASTVAVGKPVLERDTPTLQTVHEQLTFHLEWVSSKDLDLLSYFHAMKPLEQGMLLEVAKSLPRDAELVQRANNA